MFGIGSSRRERRSGTSGFGSSSSRSSMISHRTIHEDKHNKNIHSSRHDHSKIHSSMHLGRDRISNPFGRKDK